MTSDPGQRVPTPTPALPAQEQSPAQEQPVESLEDIATELGTDAEPVIATPARLPSTGAAALQAPASLTELFLAFTSLALQGFGGVLPVAQRELVERRRWLSREQFVEMLAVSQVLPGPNVVNLALTFGDRAFGWRGAVTALVGMLALPLLVVLGLTAVYGRFADIPAVSGALRGMGAVAAGLVIATGIKLLGALRRNTLGLPLCLGLAALMAIGSAWLHWPLIWLLLGLGLVSCSLAWRRIGAVPATPPATRSDDRR